MNQHARPDSAPIPFIDVTAQRRRLGRRIDEAIARVLGHCQFILGPEVRAFEAELAAFCGARFAVSCASGTDALVLVLMALGIAFAAIFRRVQPMVFGETSARRLPHPPALLPVFVHLAIVLMLGLWIPPYLAGWYRAAAHLIGAP